MGDSAIYRNKKYLSLKKRHDEQKDKAFRYEKAFNILMEYWDSIPNKNKPTINRQLTELKV